MADAGTPEPIAPDAASGAVDQAQAAVASTPQGGQADPAAAQYQDAASLPAPPPLPKKFTAPKGMHSKDTAMSEDDALLYGPQEVNHQGGVPPRYGTGPGKYADARPVNYGHWLPALQQAARDPEASPALIALVRLLQYHTEGN